MHVPTFAFFHLHSPVSRGLNTIANNLTVHRSGPTERDRLADLNEKKSAGLSPIPLGMQTKLFSLLRPSTSFPYNIVISRNAVHHDRKRNGNETSVLIGEYDRHYISWNNLINGWCNIYFPSIKTRFYHSTWLVFLRNWEWSIFLKSFSLKYLSKIQFSYCYILSVNESF